MNAFKRTTELTDSRIFTLLSSARSRCLAAMDVGWDWTETLVLLEASTMTSDAKQLREAAH